MSFEFGEGYLVIFRQGPKWVVQPFETYEEAENAADWFERKWTSSQITILRNPEVKYEGCK